MGINKFFTFILTYLAPRGKLRSFAPLINKCNSPSLSARAPVLFPLTREIFAPEREAYVLRVKTSKFLFSGKRLNIN